MKTYLCKWSNGEISILSAASRKEAFWTLDQAGDPGEAELIELDHPIAIHLKLKDKITPEMAEQGVTGNLELVSEQTPFNEELIASMTDHFAPLSKVLASGDDDEGELPTQEQIDQAVAEFKQGKLKEAKVLSFEKDSGLAQRSTKGEAI